jgi:tetratricopeptide (TPR) repeat protein
MIAQLQVAHAAFLNALGRHREAVTVAQCATAFAEATADDALKARGYAAWGTGLYRQGQYPAALARLEQGLTAAQTAQLAQVEANLHKRLANALQANHTFDHARSHYEEALALYRRDDNRPGEGEALNGLGWCSQQQHDLPGALTYLHQAEQIQQAIANPHGHSMTLINLAVVYEMLGDYSQAFICRRQVLALLEQFDDPYQRSLVNHGLGVLLSRLGDYTAAEPYYLRSLEIDRTLGDPGGVAWTQNNLGLLYNHQGDYAAALVLHQEALQSSIVLGARTTQGLAWSRLGQDYYGLGELEAAYDAYLNAITIQTELGQQVWAIESKSGLAATQLALHMQDDALMVVQGILNFLAEKSLAGAREPMLVYWNCYQVLDAKYDPRASQVLHTANQQLTEQAAKLADQKLQRTFLENVRPHHALRWAYTQRYGNAP